MIFGRFISRHFAMLRASRTLRKQQEDTTSKLNAETLSSKNNAQQKQRPKRKLGWFCTLLRRFVVYWMGEWDPGQVKALVREVYLVCPFAFVIPAALASLAAHLLSIQKSRAMGILTDRLAEAGLNATHAEGAITKGTLTSVYDHWPGGIAALQWLGFVMVLEWLCFVTRDILIGRAKTVCALASRTRYFAAMLRQDVAFHNQHSTQELVSRLETDPDCFDALSVDGIQSGVRGLVSISTLFFLLYTDWQLTALALMLRLPQVLQITGRLMQIHCEYERLINHSHTRAQTRAAESLRHIAVVQASTAESKEFKGYVALLSECLDIKASSQVVSTLLRNSEDIVLVVTEVTMLAFGGYRVLTGSLTVGTFMAYRAYVTHFMTLFAGAELYGNVKKANLLSKRLWSIRDRTPTIPLALPKITGNDDVSLARRTETRCRGEVVFDNVWFEYATGSAVLRGVDFKVPAGSVVAIVGPSGSGKSTLARLLLRFYDPTNGSILMDGKDLKSFDVRVLRREVGMVDQDATVLDRSVKENIAFGLLDPELDSVLGLGAEKPETLCQSHIADGFSTVNERTTPTASTLTTPLLDRPASGSSEETPRLPFSSSSATSPSATLDSSSSSPFSEKSEPSSELRQRVKHNNPAKSAKGGNSSNSTDNNIDSTGDSHNSGSRMSSPSSNNKIGNDLTVTMEDIRTAATQANAHDFIMSLEKGYDTVVGANRLSGGQRQRIAIARCILRNPAVLVLDEATSSLDSRTEAAVQKAFEELMRGRTSFIIAHRLATVKQASLILVLDKGKVVEQGTHQEILQKFPQGIYSSLLQHQQLLSTSD